MPLKSILFLLIFFILAACKNKKAQQEEDFCSKIHSSNSSSLSSELKHILPKMIDSTGVYVLEDGGNSLITRAWFTEKAEKSIDIQYFIFSEDNVGLIACDYLVRAADRGVKVRLLIDDMMVDADFEDILLLDSHENIEIKVFNPGVNLGKNIFGKIKKFSTDFLSANQRMHNKTFVVDDKICITGGRNIADEYFDYDHEYNFRDRDVLLMGKEVKTIHHSFEDFWNSNLSIDVKDLSDASQIAQIPDNKNKFEKLHQYACNPENFWPQVRERINTFSQTFQEIEKSKDFVWPDSVSFVSDSPIKNTLHSFSGGGETTRNLIELIKKAKSSITIQSPYLVSTQLGKNLLHDDIKRGVKIRILTNSMASTDNMEAFSGYQRDRNKLLDLGIQIYEFKPNAAERFKVMTGALQKKLNFTPIFGLHAKSMVIDGKTTVIGTFNFDPRSANLNTECITIIHSQKIAAKVLQGMETEFLPENSWKISKSFNPDKEAGIKKQVKTWTRKVIPKDIL